MALDWTFEKVSTEVGKMGLKKGGISEGYIERHFRVEKRRHVSI